MIEEQRIKDAFTRCITNSSCCTADNCTSFTDLVNCKVTYYTAYDSYPNNCYGNCLVTSTSLLLSDENLLPGIKTTIGLFIPPYDGEGYWELIWSDDASEHPEAIEKIIFHR